MPLTFRPAFRYVLVDLLNETPFLVFGMRYHQPLDNPCVGSRYQMHNSVETMTLQKRRDLTDFQLKLYQQLLNNLRCDTRIRDGTRRQRRIISTGKEFEGGARAVNASSSGDHLASLRAGGAHFGRAGWLPPCPRVPRPLRDCGKKEIPREKSRERNPAAAKGGSQRDLADFFPSFENLTALTSAYITVPITRQHLSKLLHLPRLAHLSTFTPRSNHQPTCAASVPLPSCIKSLEFLTNCPYEDAMVFSSAWQFAGLEELLITGCRGLETLPDCIGEFMPCLRKLTVRECGDFTHLPETVTLLSLETLIISGCYEYNTLPSSFDHLPALKLLVLEHLPLMALPPSFSHLTTLEALFIIECKEFWQVPADALCLTALKVLCFSESNQGLALPENVGGLGSLEALRLHGCRLPASFTTLSSLTSLDLNKCWPAELPEALGELSSLQELKFVHLSISQLPGSLTRLAALHTLEVRNCNSLSEVPMGLDALVWLKRLELMGCRQLSEAPAGLPPSLETLCLGPFREGSSLVVDISKLSQLRVLKLKCVGVVCGHERPRGCWSWDSRGRFSSWSVEGVSQARLNQLEELEMRLEGMSQEFLLPSYVLPRLRSLLIDAPGIRSLPVNMAAALPGLRQLKLLSWAPEELPRVILELSKLTSLTIHAPQLTSLPEGVSCLSRLRKVELIRCTALQHLPESLTHMQQLVLLQDTSLPSLPAGSMHCLISAFIFLRLPCPALSCLPCLVFPAPALSCLPCLVLPALPTPPVITSPSLHARFNRCTVPRSPLSSPPPSLGGFSTYQLSSSSPSASASISRCSMMAMRAISAAHGITDAADCTSAAQFHPSSLLISECHRSCTSEQQLAFLLLRSGGMPVITTTYGSLAHVTKVALSRGRFVSDCTWWVYALSIWCLWSRTSLHDHPAPHHDTSALKVRCKAAWCNGGRQK
ncbi:unnamed protein product [Closterium sp. NIES-54]